MIQSRLFRTHFAIAALSILGCVLVGSWVLSFVVQKIEDRSEQRSRAQRQRPEFYANFVEEFGPKDPVEGLKKLEKLQGPNDPQRFAIANAKGEVVYPRDYEVQGELPLPKEVHAWEEAIQGPAPPPPLFSFGAPPPRPPRVTVVRLRYDQPFYLISRFRPRVGAAAEPPRFFPLSILVMISMVLLGIAVALFMIFRSLREHVRMADHVISELQKGNLKARFPIERNDEIGHAKGRFNAMADEIERLVERLRGAESSRNNLLQELAHDLRTPVASLRSIHESVFDSAELAAAERELAELAQKEVEYMGRLVDDLLLLAQLSEPSYQQQDRLVDFVAILEEEADSIALRKENLRVVKHLDVPEALLRGDDHLFRRLVRNGLENAASYARGLVEVTVRLEDGRLHVAIRDDGPGFAGDEMTKFGERRGQRMIKKSQGGRLSLGLGSVIMKSVIGLNRGELRASNGPGGGAVVEFWLPV